MDGPVLPRLNTRVHQPPASDNFNPRWADWFFPGRFAFLLALLICAAFPQVVLGLAQFRGLQQIAGEHLVRQDGTISLGTYGCVYVAGLSLEQTRFVIEQYLSQFLLAFALAVFFSASVLRGFGPVVMDGNRNLVSLLAAFTGAQYLGTLLGTAWIQTLVAHRQTWHYAALAQHLSFSDPQVATRVAELSGSVARFVNDPAARSLQGLTTLSQQVTRESFVLAYNDVFLATAVIATAMLVWLSWLSWRGFKRQAAAAAAAAAAANAGTNQEK